MASSSLRRWPTEAIPSSRRSSAQPLQDRIVDVIVAESRRVSFEPQAAQPTGDPTRLVHVDEPPAGASEAEAHAFYEEQRRTLFGTL
jgi:hypothetical protein